MLSKRWVTRNSIGSPEELKLELTLACPLGCVHCSANAGQDKNHQIPLRIAEKIIREFSEIGGSTLILTGGEPLCYPNLLEIIEVAKQESLAVLVYTTGIKGAMVSPALEILKYIADIADGFLCCLYGANSRIHDSITGVNGSFEATLAAIQYLLTFGKPITVHHVPLLINMGELVPLCKLLTDNGIDSLKLLRFIPQGRGFYNRTALQLRMYGIFQLKEQLFAARSLFPGLMIDLGAPYSPLCESNIVLCKAGVKTLSISAALNCAPCDGFKATFNGAYTEPLGTRSLREFWFHSSMLKAVRIARQKFICSGCKGCLSQSILFGNVDPCASDPLQADVINHKEIIPLYI